MGRAHLLELRAEMNRPIDRIDVNPVRCNGCTACCEEDLIVLHPDKGDQPQLYLTMTVTHPVFGTPAIALQKQPDGKRCVYLEPGKGCRIYGHRPLICREFDCRRFVKRFSRHERKLMLEKGTISEAVLNAGLERMDTL